MYLEFWRAQLVTGSIIASIIAESRIVPADPKKIALNGESPSLRPRGTASLTSRPGMVLARKVEICGGICIVVFDTFG